MDLSISKKVAKRFGRSKASKHREQKSSKDIRAAQSLSCEGFQNPRSKSFCSSFTESSTLAPVNAFAHSLSPEEREAHQKKLAALIFDEDDDIIPSTGEEEVSVEEEKAGNPSLDSTPETAELIQNTSSKTAMVKQTGCKNLQLLETCDRNKNFPCFPPTSPSMMKTRSFSSATSHTGCLASVNQTSASKTQSLSYRNIRASLTPAPSSVTSKSNKVKLLPAKKHHITPLKLKISLRATKSSKSPSLSEKASRKLSPRSGDAHSKLTAPIDISVNEGGESSCCRGKAHCLSDGQTLQCKLPEENAAAPSPKAKPAVTCLSPTALGVESDDTQNLSIDELYKLSGY